MRLFQRVMLLLIFTMMLTACQPLLEDPRPHGQTFTYQVTDSMTSVFFQLEIEALGQFRNSRVNIRHFTFN